MNGEHLFTTSTILEKSRDEVFPFFSNAENLEKITPPDLNFQILSPLPIEMKVGAIIDYQIKLMGVSFKWKTEITKWNPPYSFEDVQLKGPYRQWIHTHTFEEVEGKTIMTDYVRYALPIWPFGQVAFPFVSFKIKQIFKHRNKVIHQLLET